jgi:hypothetical protein
MLKVLSRWLFGAKLDRLPITAMSTTVVALLLHAADYSALGRPAEAQTSQPALTVSTEINLQPGSQMPLGLQIRSTHPIPPQVLLVIRGLPATISLSEGRAFGPGVWAVPVAGLNNLKITAMKGYNGDNQLSFTLVSFDGETLAEARSMLRIGSRDGKTVSLTAAALPDAPTHDELPTRAAPLSAPPPAPLSQEEKNRTMKLVQKGEESMQTGNVTVARLFYRRAADSGLALGALKLAGTYDATELSQMKVIGGVQPDPEQAKKWYKRAIELGAAEAPERLHRLGQK